MISSKTSSCNDHSSDSVSKYSSFDDSESSCCHYCCCLCSSLIIYYLHCLYSPYLSMRYSGDILIFKSYPNV